jgi:hypothetical protein
VIGATAVALASVGCSQDRPTEQVSTLPAVTAVLTSGVGITSTKTRTLDGFIAIANMAGFVTFVR